MVKRYILALVVLLSIGLAAFTTSRDLFVRNTPDREVGLQESIVVLELFTSQGCSSCPPADALLARIQNQSDENVFALSYHVDYWNYIGWEDPFSSQDHTARQSRYNRKFGSRSNYTPQLVVNGKEHFVGSNATKLNQSILTYSRVGAENQISISEIEKKANQLSFKYDVSGDLRNKNLRTALVIDSRTTSVQRGENRNRKLTNNNIVVAEMEIELQSQKGRLKMDIPAIVESTDKIRLIVLVENDLWDITGAGKSGYIQ